MRNVPPAIAEFLSQRRIAVAGVSRDSRSAANLIYRTLRKAGYDVWAVNPNATEVEGGPCYADLAALPEQVDGVVIATHPDVATEVVARCADRGIPRVWFHRSFGQGSVLAAAVDAARAHGLAVIEGGCPVMFCEPVDLGHRCMRGILRLAGRLPR